MIGEIVSTLPGAAAVTEQLVVRYGADLLWQVEQLSEHIFRGWLTNGGVVLAMIQPDGGLQIRELEDVS